MRKENRLIFAFSPALAPGASVALLAVSLTKNQETRLDFEKALVLWEGHLSLRGDDQWAVFRNGRKAELSINCGIPG